MNILVTLNSNYLPPLKVMLKSLFCNNPGADFRVFLMHTSIKPEEISDLNRFMRENGQSFSEIKIPADYFENAPVIFYYTKEMYYRLLAHEFLPQEIDRILYLDADILVLNPVQALYESDMEGYLYAAAYHDMPAIKEANKIRLSPYNIDVYYNSGVLLMNLALQRQEVDKNTIFDFVAKHQARLIMPDQDILNALYAKKIKTLDEKIYNFDARYYRYYKLSSNGLCDMDYIIHNTVFLHFCGNKKPWKKRYNGVFQALYKHYEKIALG